MVTSTISPGQALCTQTSPGYRAPGDLMPGSRELPGRWRSWRICWWWRWSRAGRGRAGPAEGACARRRARSAWSSWRRSRACTPPAALETQATQRFRIKLIIPFRKKRIFNALSFHNTVINIQHIMTALTRTSLLRNPAPLCVFCWVTEVTLSKVWTLSLPRLASCKPKTHGKSD